MTSTLVAPYLPSHVRPLRARRNVLANVVANVVAPSLSTPEAAVAAVFAAVRQRGPVARDTIAALSGLSVATVNRQVSALLEAQLLRERPDLAAAGAIGRPRIPVEINHEPYLTLGVHVGARTTSIVASDLFGRALDAVETPTPGGSQAAALAALADSARRYLSRWHRRRALWAGVTIGGVVDSAGGYVDHTRLGWSRAPLGPVLAGVLGLPVSVASHVDAMAGAELLLGTHPRRGSGLYVYARETVGFALVIDGRVHSPASGPGTVAGLPVQSDLLGGSGQLESTVSDEAVVAAARRTGILPATGPNSAMTALLRVARQRDGAAASGARALLAERARVLGGAVALIRDMLNPDDLVVGGQAFTEYPEGLDRLRASFAERSLLAAKDIRVTAFGNRVQEAGASVVSLSSIYADPLASLRRARQTSARRAV
ncbi:MAG: ROK family protein [Mycobacterium sp.]